MSASSPKAHLGYHLLHKLSVNKRKKKKREREREREKKKYVSLCMDFLLCNHEAMESPGSDYELIISFFPSLVRL